MPPLPVFSSGVCFIGRVEVDGEIHAEHLADAHGHVTVPAEVQIQFEGKAQCHQPCGRRVQPVDLLEALIDDHRQGVCQKHLFHQTQTKEHDAVRKILCGKGSLSKILQLGDQLAVQYDRACDQLWEEGDEGGIIQKRQMPGLPPASVDDKGELLQGKEADTQGQNNVFQRKVGMKDGIQVVQKEVIVFVVAQKPHISHTAHQAADPAHLVAGQPIHHKA